MKTSKKSLIQGKPEDKAEDGEPIFAEHLVPSKKQVDQFEATIKGGRSIADKNSTDSLAEIYRDRSGEIADVSHIKHHQESRLVSFFKKFFVIAVVACLGYGFYVYFFRVSSDAVSVDLTVSAPGQVTAGEEFSYTVHYQNHSKFSLDNLQLELKYPSQFVVSGVSGSGVQAIAATSSIAADVSGIAATSTAPVITDNYFNLPAVPVGGSGDIIVKGRLIGEKDSASQLVADLSYQPGGFSSEFKKEAAATVLINDLGLALNYQYADASLVGQTNEIELQFDNVSSSFFSDFEVSFSLPENITLVDGPKTATSSATTTPQSLRVDKAGSLIWEAHGLNPGNSYQLPIYYRVNQKIADNQTIVIKLSRKLADGSTYVFASKNIDLNIINSNLELSLVVNGNKGNGVTDFGQTLHYSLTYTNKGEADLKDISLMAVVKGDLLDWQALKNPANGLVGDNSLTWTKEQLPALADLAPGASGTLDFDLAVKKYDSSDLGKDSSIESYGQFNINDRPASLNDSRSNDITLKVNSNLGLEEKALYFNDDNVPVGTGPLPPKVGQKTTVRVSWKITNDWHELDNVRVVSPLPSYVNFEGAGNVASGNLTFDPASHAVVWNIGSWPVSSYQTTADFNLSVTPTAAQRDTILVLLPGSTVSAVDQETKGELSKKNKPKTTRLEDDNIASLNNSGVVK